MKIYRIKLFFKNLIPPIFLIFYRKVFSINEIKFIGPFVDWETAKKYCYGYDSVAIIDKVKNAALKVKNGEYAYERDSILFEKKDYNWFLTTAIYQSINGKEKLKIIDFGGSLGSTYFQNKDIFTNLEIEWYILEQDTFVNIGKKYFQNEELLFHNNINNLPITNYNICIISSSLQYIENYTSILDSIFSKEPEYILLDRTVISYTNKNLIYIQKNPKNINKSSYPTHIFSESNLLKYFKNNNYEIKYSNDSLFFPELKSISAFNKGYLFRRSKS